MSTPKRIKVDELGALLSLPIDVFICSASFEDRCKTVSDNINSEIVKQVIICENEDLKSIIAPNGNYLANKYGKKAKKIELWTNDSLRGADNLRSGLFELHSSVNSYLIDISTFTHEALLILVKILRDIVKGKNKKIQFVYTSAKEYSLDFENPEDKWLSKGIGEIRSVLGYPGITRPSRKAHLIVLLGFESERAAKLIDSYEPAMVSIGLGADDSSISGKHHLVNQKFFNQVTEIYNNVNKFAFSCVDPFSAMRSIQDQMKKFEQFNTVVAPMNNKISTLGAALAALDNDSIQVCYAHAKQYNYENYSVPGDDCYLFDLEGYL